MIEYHSKTSPKYLSVFSLLLSSITIFAVIYINSQIAVQFEKAAGKTRALFGLIEITYNYKYYWAIGSIIAMALGVLSYKKSKRKSLPTLAIAIALLSSTLSSIKIWPMLWSIYL